MELRQLKCFVSAATHLSFTKAAKECFLVQSSMTEQIFNLENELGVKLFERRYRGLSLTDAGEFFLPRARNILLEAQKSRKEMDAFRDGYRTTLRIGYRGELFKEDLIRCLKAFRAEYPTVRVTIHQLQEKELMEGLRDGQFDLILTTYRKVFEEETAWLEWMFIEETGPVLVVNRDHPLAGRDSVSFADLKDMPILRLKDQRMEPENRTARSDTQIQQNIEPVMDHTSQEILIASGYGAGLWPKRLSQSISNPDLAFVQFTGEYETAKYMLAWKRGKLTGEANSFCTCFSR